ncbi:MAG: hypothetical protein ABI183_11705 [Polyangiaceae bacterium]
MSHHQFAIAFSFCVLGWCTKGHADPIARQGTIIIGLDRIVPVIAITHDRIGSQSTTRASYGTAPGSDDVYNVPRLGLDVVAFHHISFGAASALRIDTGSPSNVPGADPLTSLFSFTPRAGYVAQVAPEIAFWPRAGLTLSEVFTRSNADNVRTTNLRMDAAAAFEVSMVATPIRMLGVTMTLGTELPLMGKNQQTTPTGTSTQSTSRIHFVIDAGVIAHF